LQKLNPKRKKSCENTNYTLKSVFKERLVGATTGPRSIARKIFGKIFQDASAIVSSKMQNLRKTWLSPWGQTAYAIVTFADDENN